MQWLSAAPVPWWKVLHKQRPVPKHLPLLAWSWLPDLLSDGGEWATNKMEQLRDHILRGFVCGSSNQSSLHGQESSWN